MKPIALYVSLKDYKKKNNVAFRGMQASSTKQSNISLVWTDAKKFGSLKRKNGKVDFFSLVKI